MRANAHQNKRAHVVFALGVATAATATPAALLGVVLLPPPPPMLLDGLRVCCVLASSVGNSRAVIGMCGLKSLDAGEDSSCACGCCARSVKMAGDEMDDWMGRAVSAVWVAMEAAGGVVATAALCAQGANFTPEADWRGEGRVAWRWAS